jgi:hypothetical protein
MFQLKGTQAVAPPMSKLKSRTPTERNPDSKICLIRTLRTNRALLGIQIQEFASYFGFTIATRKYI